MVVLAPDHEIQPGDLPRHIREGGSARLLPVHIGPIVRGQQSASGRELEFIVRSLLELKLQVEDLRRQIDTPRVDTARVADHPGDTPLGLGGWIGEGRVASHAASSAPVATSVAPIEPRNQAPPPNIVTVTPGTKMADIERSVIEAALKETRGNRRRAAEMLGIGERTLYRKIKEYRVPEYEFVE
jgi:DNA-binding NtrC family response regulator